VCLPNKVEKCLWNQEATGTAWTGLEQNIIDTAVNEWRKCLLDDVRIASQHLKQFYGKQLKIDNWMKCQPRCRKCEQIVFLRIMLIKQSYRIR